MKHIITITILLSYLSAVKIGLFTATDNGVSYNYLLLEDTKNDILCEKLYNNEIKHVNLNFIQCSVKVGVLRNNFKNLDYGDLKIKSYTKDKRLYFLINYKHQIELYKTFYDIVHEKSYIKKSSNSSKRWFILMHKEPIDIVKPFKLKNKSMNLNFFFKNQTLPIIGNLDADGNPIKIKVSKYLKEYLTIKDYYKNKLYNLIVRDYETFSSSYKNNPFSEEILIYYIRALDKLGKYEKLGQKAKDFTYKYNNSIYKDEVLYYSINDLLKRGVIDDAKYYFNTLKSSYPDSKYISLAYIAIGDLLLGLNKTKGAVSAYKSAYNSAKTLDVASRSAKILVKYYLNLRDITNSTKYILKILNGNPIYIEKYREQFFNFANKFSIFNRIDISAKISNLIMQNFKYKRDNINYSNQLLSTASWQYSSKNYKLADKYYKRFLKLFPYSKDRDLVISRIDNIKSKWKTNSKLSVKDYDKIIDKYNGKGVVADDALYSKLKVLYKKKDYLAIIKSKSEIKRLGLSKYKDLLDIYKNSLINYFNKKGDFSCENIEYLNNREYFYIAKNSPERIYECTISNNLEFAKKLALSMIKNDDLKVREKWLYRLSNILYKNRDYKNLLNSSNDLINIFKTIKNVKKYINIYVLKFNALLSLNRVDEAVKFLNDLEKLRGESVLNLDMYYKLYSYYNGKDDLLVKLYGLKVLSIQAKNSINIYTPQVDFKISEIYIKENQNSKALDILNKLLNSKASNVDLSRVYYMIGNIKQNEGKMTEAKKNYNLSIKNGVNTKWGLLSKQILTIL